MKRAGALIVAMSLTACVSAPPKLACPAGQTQLRTAQLFLSLKAPARLSETELRSFLAGEVTPRFPDGVTVVDGGGQWKGDDNRLIREAAKVVLIVLPAKGDPQAQVEAVRTAYRARFKQDSVVVMPPPACVAL